MQVFTKQRGAWLAGLLVTLMAIPAGVGADDDDSSGPATIHVQVSGKAIGGFGFLSGIGAPGESPLLQLMVEAVTLSEGQSATISASGEIQLFPGKLVGPDGEAFLPRVPGDPGFSPLEEALVDAGAFPTADPVPDLGALMGAFVPEEDIGPDFLAFNDDPNPGLIPDPPLLVGDIPSSALFLIGAGPFTFVAPDDGTLFLGVNDAFTGNNDLVFEVTIVVSPDGDDDDDEEDDDDDEDGDD